MEEIIAPVDRSLLRAELTREHWLRKTNNSGNEIYVFDHRTAPSLMQEVGRLRELTFRSAGGGTGKAVDIDRFDLMEKPFRQLIVWNPDEEEIVGGYRFIHCRDLETRDGEAQSPTSRLFRISHRFHSEFLPSTIELGRSFVQPAYQPMLNIRKGMYSLDNLWDGLGALVVDNPDIRYFFGKITMYPHLDRTARDLILHFLKTWFPDPDHLVEPFSPLLPVTDPGLLREAFGGEDYEADYKALVQRVRGLGEGIPPLVNAYMNLSRTMRFFGTSLNDHFGDVEESAILVTIADIHDSKMERHVFSYQK